MQAIGIRHALKLLSDPAVRLVRQFTDESPAGYAHYIVPGGYVEPDVAEKIKKHPSVVQNHDGLFPEYDQTWMMVR